MLDILNNFSAVLWSSSFLFRFRFLRRVAKLSSNCSGWVWFWWSCYVLLCCPFNPLSFVVWAAGCPCQCTVRVPTILSEDFLCVSLYRQSTYYLVWGFSLVLSKYLPSCLRIFLYCQSTFLDALAKSHQPLLPGVSKYAVKAPSIWGSYTCQVSPNVLSKYQQSGGVTLILACLDFHCTVRVPSFPVWGCCLYCQSTTLMHLKSHINRCCQVSPNMLSKHHQFWGSYTC